MNTVSHARLSMPLGEAIFTQRSIRRLKPDPIAAEDLRLILEAAVRAPNGGNAQPGRFVVVTDHGDGTAAPDPPAYRSSVLCITGVEISTTGGHCAVVGMRQAPYPLAGEARDVVEDVRRLGGFGVVAHGDSPRPELRWNDWDAPIDGLEWLNLDSIWRAARFSNVARALVGYWLRPPEALASLSERPGPMLERWDALNRTRPVIGLAATDVHGQILPSYEAAFRTLSTHVEIGDSRLTGDASHDAQVIVDALKAGRHYSVVDAQAGPSEFGLHVEDLTPERGHRIGVEGQKGVVVTEVEPASFAEDINLGRGDVITEINRVPIYSVADYRKAVSGLKPGDDITFKVLRRQDGDRMLTLYLSGKIPSESQQ